MTAVYPEASRQAVVEAALVLLERMGLSPADLAALPQDRKPVPTFAEYVPVGRGQRRDPPGIWLVLEPDPRALGQSAPGRAHPLRDPAADGLRQNPRGGPP
jgi:integrase/recombinase XerC